MYAKVYGATIDGLDGVVVTVEVDLTLWDSQIKL